MAKEGITKPDTFKTWTLKLPKAKQQFGKEIEMVLSRNTELMLRRIRFHYLTGGSLKVQSGRLRSSVTKQPSTGARKAGNYYIVELGTNVFYGEVWEKGVTIPARTIRPTNKKALRFFVAGHVVYAKRVFQPSRTIIPRPWLAPGIRDGMPRLRKDLKNIPATMLSTRR